MSVFGTFGAIPMSCSRLRSQFTLPDMKSSACWSWVIAVSWTKLAFVTTTMRAEFVCTRSSALPPFSIETPTINGVVGAAAASASSFASSVVL